MKMLLGVMFAIGILTVSCQTAEFKKESSESSTALTPEDWRMEMNYLFVNYKKLLPFIYGTNARGKVDDRKVVAANLKSLALNGKRLKKIPVGKYPDQDPSLQIMLDNMEANFRVAEQSFSRGDYRVSKQRLKSSASYCFYCHTRMAKGLQLEWGGDAKDINITAPFEKADFLVASRRFKESETVLKALVEDKNQSSYARGRALEKLITVGLKVRDKPELSKFVIKNMLKNKEIGAYKKKMLQSWYRDIGQWKRQKSRVNNLGQIKRYISVVKLGDRLEVDDTRFVRYLLASEKLHELLAKPLSKKDRATAYYLLGHTYGVIRDSVTWELNEVYYEACIRQVPRTLLAQQCYRDLEDSIAIGYSGSAGVFIPVDIEQKLELLKEKAFQ